MSLIHTRRKGTGETPEQTLARLNVPGSTGEGPIPDPPHESRFAVAPKKRHGYTIAEVDKFIDTIDQRTADEVRAVRFSTARTRSPGYDEDEVDRFLDDHIARLIASTPASGPVPPTPTPTQPGSPAPTKRSVALGTRLAHVPQQRWTPICIAFWFGLVLWVALGTTLTGILLPEGRQDGANAIVLLAALAVSLVFWAVAVSRTGHMDPSEWTDGQRVSKYVWDHWGDGGGA